MDEFDEALALDVRRKIYNLIKRSPGLHFREIQRRTKVAVGSLQYHLDFLEKRHLIRAYRHGKFVRYYAVREADLREDEELFALLRQDSVRRIVLFLLTNKKANNESIANAVNLSPSTTSWHISKLVKSGLVEKRRHGRKSFFCLSDPNRAAKLLTGYRKSFLDEMVDQFAEIWEEI